MGKKHFVVIVCKLFSTEEILKRHIKDCFKINGKQSILMPKKGEYGQFKNYERKTKSPFIIGSFIKRRWGRGEGGLTDNLNINPLGVRVCLFCISVFP